jgi:hypothetical protein
VRPFVQECRQSGAGHAQHMCRISQRMAQGPMISLMTNPPGWAGFFRLNSCAETTGGKYTPSIGDHLRVELNSGCSPPVNYVPELFESKRHAAPLVRRRGECAKSPPDR